MHAVINLSSREIKLFESYGDAIRYTTANTGWIYQGKVELEVK